LLAIVAQIDDLHVRYRGTAPVVTAVPEMASTIVKQDGNVPVTISYRKIGEVIAVQIAFFGCT
jgi:hypothetical protein